MIFLYPASSVNLNLRNLSVDVRLLDAGSCCPALFKRGGLYSLPAVFNPVSFICLCRAGALPAGGHYALLQRQSEAKVSTGTGAARGRSRYVTRTIAQLAQINNADILQRFDLVAVGT